MSKCDTCKYSTKFDGDGWSICDNCVHDPSLGDMYAAATNADHIRSLGDEELALDMMRLNFCPPNADEYKECSANANCHQCWVDWLKQPYKEDA